MVKKLQITDLDLKQIGQQVAEGYTSGILDGEEDDGTSTRISWRIKIEDKFKL